MRLRQATVDKGGAPASGWALLALLALIWQSFVVQTHVHVPPAAMRVAVTASAATASAADDRAGQAGLDCPSCRLLARSAATLRPGAALSPPAETTRPRLFVPRLPAVRPLLPRHAWRNRGPPQASAPPLP